MPAQRRLPLILASQSPRRRQLLEDAGYTFQIVVPDANAEPVDEQLRRNESISQFVQRLARQKAADVAARVSQPALVVGCDTVADIDGQILGKPRDRADAQRMLMQLSGRRHSVWSGLCIQHTTSKRSWSESAESQLDMRLLAPWELQSYLDSGQWQGKSGAFGFQDGPPWLALVAGSADNVVGLPLELLARLLQQAQSIVDNQS
ncbi:MAG: septum formation protein Maf [Pirellulaceae bacterium]|nr:septum formation protein Maf [Pirellulaceae bacterium]